MNTPRSCVRCGARSWLVTSATGAVVCTRCFDSDDDAAEVETVREARRRLDADGNRIRPCSGR